MMITEGPAELRKMGLTVIETDGCHTRGKPFPSRPDGALRHWTAGGAGYSPSLRIVTYGRGEPNPLEGPLAQVLQSRQVDTKGLDICYWVASGKANHAGDGNWNGIRGNYALLGNEIEWSGPSEPFGPKRVLSSELVMRGLLNCCAGANDNDVAEHREYALPAGRKIDTNLDGNVLRRRMTELRLGAGGDDEMIFAPNDDAGRKHYVTTAYQRIVGRTPKDSERDAWVWRIATEGDKVTLDLLTGLHYERRLWENNRFKALKASIDGHTHEQAGVMSEAEILAVVYKDLTEKLGG